MTRERWWVQQRRRQRHAQGLRQRGQRGARDCTRLDGTITEASARQAGVRERGAAAVAVRRGCAHVAQRRHGGSGGTATALWESRASEPGGIGPLFRYLAIGPDWPVFLTFAHYAARESGLFRCPNNGAQPHIVHELADGLARVDSSSKQLGKARVVAQQRGPERQRVAPAVVRREEQRPARRAASRSPRARGYSHCRRA